MRGGGAGAGSLIASARLLLDAGALRNPAARNLRAFLEALSGWRKAAEAEPLPLAARKVLEESGYLDSWRNDKSFEAQGRVENLESFLDGLADFDSLEAFLEHVSLVMEQWQGAEEERVSVMTLHAAKGLEFDAVFLAGWEEGLFPHAAALGDRAGLEEERRLAYVGMTRARRQPLHHPRLQPAACAGAPRCKRPPPSSASCRRMRWRSCMRRSCRGMGWRPGVAASLRGLTSRAAAGGAAEARAGGAAGAAGGRTIAARKVPVWGKGAAVEHEVFGRGTALQQDGEWVEVAFETGEQKVILASYLAPA